jgi:hypothetical protein
MKKMYHSEQGFSRVVLIAAIVVLAVIGIGGWLIAKSGNPPANANTEAVREALKNAKCDGKDADVCKFFVSWKASRYYTAKITTKVGTTTNTSVIKVDGKNYYAKINSELPLETIVIGKASYTKDTEKNKWYKQELVKEGTTGFNFDKSDLQSDGGKYTYKKVGKEKCGELNCFKYEVINAEDRGLKQHVWFDDQDYQLRKHTTEQKETFATTSTTFSYGKVTISEPSPFTELRGGDIYIPGQGVVNPSLMPY